jgi:prophage maintenance system killer protein
MSRNHGFLDGNKRTAWLLVEILIDRSGYRLNIPDELKSLIEKREADERREEERRAEPSEPVAEEHRSGEERRQPDDRRQD